MSFNTFQRSGYENAKGKLEDRSSKVGCWIYKSNIGMANPRDLQKDRSAGIVDLFIGSMNTDVNSRYAQCSWCPCICTHAQSGLDIQKFFVVFTKQTLKMSLEFWILFALLLILICLVVLALSCIWRVNSNLRALGMDLNEEMREVVQRILFPNLYRRSFQAPGLDWFRPDPEDRFTH